MQFWIFECQKRSFTSDEEALQNPFILMQEGVLGNNAMVIRNLHRIEKLRKALTCLNLRKLKNLILSLHFLTSLGAGFQKLLSLESLEVLDISSCLIPDDSTFISFASARNLKSLNLSFCRTVTNDTIVSLTHCKNLKHLNLAGSSGYEATPEVFLQLKEMIWLESLVLSSNECITDSIGDILSSLTKLKHLDISNLNITDNLFPALKNLSSLECLDLEGCEDITLKGLELLIPLTKDKLKNIKTRK